MVQTPSEPTIVRRMNNRYKFSVRAYVVSQQDWDKYFQWLLPDVRNDYEQRGFYDITWDWQLQRQFDGRHTLGVTAMTFKGVPVVSYADASKMLLHIGRKDVVLL